MPTIEELKSGTNADGKTFRVHLDGDNQLDYLKGEAKTGPRRDFPIWSDDGELVALPCVTGRQFHGAAEARRLSRLARAAHGLPHTQAYNLRIDPFERADSVSDQYDNWRVKNAYLWAS